MNKITRFLNERLYSHHIEMSTVGSNYQVRYYGPPEDLERSYDEMKDDFKKRINFYLLLLRIN